MTADQQQAGHLFLVQVCDAGGRIDRHLHHAAVVLAVETALQQSNARRGGSARQSQPEGRRSKQGAATYREQLLCDQSRVHGASRHVLIDLSQAHTHGERPQATHCIKVLTIASFGRTVHAPTKVTTFGCRPHCATQSANARIRKATKQSGEHSEALTRSDISASRMNA